MAVDGHLNFDTKVDTNGFNTGTKKLSSSLGGLKSMFGKVAVAAAAAFSVKAISQFATESNKMYQEQMMQEVKLETIMRQRMGATDSTIKSIKDYASELQKTGVIGDEVQLAGAQQVATYLNQADSLKELMPAMNNLLAQQKGLNATTSDAANIGNLFGKVMQGQTSALKRCGITFTSAEEEVLKYGSETERAAMLAQVVTNNVGNMNAELAKTNAGKQKQLSNTYGDLKEQLGQSVDTLKQLLLPSLARLVNVFATVVKYAQMATNAIAEVFGIEMQTSTAAGIYNEDTSAVAENYSDIAENAEKTQKANEKSLAGFDKITKLSEPTDDNSSSTTPLPSAITLPTVTQKVDVDTSKAGKKLKDLFNTVKTTLKKVGKFIKDNFGGIFNGIWDGLKGEGLELWGTFNDIFGDLKTLIEPFKEYLSGDFTTFLQTFVSTVGDILVGLFDSYNMVFSDIWNLAVYPIVSKFITTALPMITQFYTQVTSTLGALFNSVKEIFDRLWAELVAPVLEWVTSVITDIFDLLKEKWEEWGKPTFDNIKETIETIKEVFLSAWENVLKPCFDKIMEVVDKVWKEHLQPLVSEFLDFVGELVNGAMEIYNKFIAPIVMWLQEKLGPVFTLIFGKIADRIGESIGEAIDIIRGFIRVIKGIVQFITGVFTGDWKKAWEGVKNIFGGIWDTISNLLADPVNAIVDTLNWLLGKVEDFINWIIDGVNKINIDIPDKIAEKIGIEHIGFNLDNISIPEIPPLATGTVVPANYGNFLAVLGDNKREPEVVSPLSTMEQALGNALQKYGGVGGDIVVHLTTELDGRKMHKEIVRINKQEIRKTSNNPLVPVM